MNGSFQISHDSKILYVFTYLNPAKHSHSIEVVYFATFTDPIEKIKLNPKDHSKYNWSTIEEISASIQEKGDEEYLAIQKGFQLLKGSNLDFA